MGAGQPQGLAQELDEQSAGLGFCADGLAVHRHGYGGHGYSLLEIRVGGRVWLGWAAESGENGSRRGLARLELV
jgi:hypothetical protein